MWLVKLGNSMRKILWVSFTLLIIAVPIFPVVFSEAQTNSTKTWEFLEETYENARIWTYLTTDENWDTHNDYKVTVEVWVEDIGDSDHFLITKIEIDMGSFSLTETMQEVLGLDDTYTFETTIHPTEDNMYLYDTEKTESLRFEINGYEYYYSYWDVELNDWTLWIYESVDITVTGTPPEVEVDFSDTQVEKGEEIAVNVTVKYPDGCIEDEAWVSIENTLVYESCDYIGEGIYTADIDTTYFGKGDHKIKVDVNVTPFPDIIKKYTINVRTSPLDIPTDIPTELIPWSFFMLGILAFVIVVIVSIIGIAVYVGRRKTIPKPTSPAGTPPTLS